MRASEVSPETFRCTPVGRTRLAGTSSRFRCDRADILPGLGFDPDFRPGIVLPRLCCGFAGGLPRVPVRGPTEHSLSYRAPTLVPSVPVLGGVRPRVKSAGFGPTFFRPSLPEGETQQTKKAIRDKCPISPTKSKSIGTEGSCPRTFPRVCGRGSAPGGRLPICTSSYL